MTEEQDALEVAEKDTKEIPKHDKTTELENHLKRVQAEFENYKKRVAKEKEELILRGNANMMKKLLEFVDEFELASMHITHGGKKSDEHVKGMEMLYANLLSLLKSEGVEEMKDVEKFDPYKHEAIRQEESNKPEGTIISVIKKGYSYKGSILRHAMVIISKGNEQVKK